MYPFLYFKATIQTSSLISIFLSFDKINRYYNRKKKKKKTLQMKLASEGALVAPPRGTTPQRSKHNSYSLSLSIVLPFSSPFGSKPPVMGRERVHTDKKDFPKGGVGLWKAVIIRCRLWIEKILIRLLAFSSSPSCGCFSIT